MDLTALTVYVVLEPVTIEHEPLRYIASTKDKAERWLDKKTSKATRANYIVLEWVVDQREE